MEDKKAIKMNKILIFIFLLAGCFQNITICNIAGFNMKLVHLVSILFLIPLAARRNKFILIPNKSIMIYLVFILIHSLIAYQFYGFNSFFVNYLFVIYTLIIIVNVGKEIPKDDWIKMINTVAIIFLVCVYIKLIINYKSIFAFLNNYLINTNTNDVRLWIDTFMGGGINLEATWIAIFGFSFTQNKKGVIYFIFSFLISIIYSSRAAILLNILLAIFLVIAYIKRNKMNPKAIITMFLILIFIMLLVCIMIEITTGLISYSIERFLSIGNENGSIGRLKMWEYIWETFYNNPLGYGIGNTIVAIENISNISFVEDNVHNLFFQNLLDSGIFGFCIYVYINIGFIIKERKQIYTNPIVQIILAYIFISILEFRGAEFILYCIIGMYFITDKKGERNEQSSSINVNI